MSSLPFWWLLVSLMKTLLCVRKLVIYQYYFGFFVYFCNSHSGNKLKSFCSPVTASCPETVWPALTRLDNKQVLMIHMLAEWWSRSEAPELQPAQRQDEGMRNESISGRINLVVEATGRRGRRRSLACAKRCIFAVMRLSWVRLMRGGDPNGREKKKRG